MNSDQKKMALCVEIDKGYIAKVVFDALSTNMSRIIMNLSKKGVNIRVADGETVNTSRIMWDVCWPRKNCGSPYICTKEMWISLNVKSLQQMLKSVKKKNAIRLYINNSDLNTLFIVIYSTNTQGGTHKSSETVNISIQQLTSKEDIGNAKDIYLPDTFINEDNETVKTYGEAMVIASAEFQKVKKLTSLCKTDILVTMQKSNYISFRVGDSNVVGNVLEFGELTYNPECEETFSNDEEDDDENEEEENDGEEEEQEDVEEDEISEGDNDEYPFIYKHDFSPSLFASIIKLTGLSAKIEFYAPQIDNFPLKISAMASSGLGIVTVYIKNQEQIKMIEKQ